MQPPLRFSVLLLLCGFAALPAAAQAWSGFHAGFHGGGAKASATTRVQGRASGVLLPEGFIDGRNTSMHTSDTTAFFGGQIGYDWHRDKALFGLEGDVSSGKLKTTRTEPIHYLDGTELARGVASTRQEVSMLASVRCRVGYTPSDHWLIYLTGGAGYAEVKYSSDMDYRNVPGYGFHLPGTFKGHVMGRVVGAGVEATMGTHLSARLEYLRYDFNKRTETGFATPVTLTNDFQYTWDENVQVVRAAVNFRF